MCKTLGHGAPSPDLPFALKGLDGRKRVLTAVNDMAARERLYAGMPVAQAQALVENLVLKDADPFEDNAALDRLALWALRRFSPLVAADPPDGLVIDTTGADHLKGGEDAMLKDMVDALAEHGVTARAAIGDTWGAAHALARFVANPTIVTPPQESAAHVRGLPLHALRLPASLIETLRTLGFRKVSDLSSQPRAPLTLRFGAELGRRLDQALGHERELIDPVRSPELIEVSRAFAEPIGAAETIARYIGKLTTQLCDRLENGAIGARRIDLLCYRTDNRIEAAFVGMARPVRDVRKLTRLLCDKIETIDPGFGIDRMTLTATAAEPLVPKQLVSQLGEAEDADVSALFDILANRAGPAKLYRLAPVTSDVPERSIKKVAPMEKDTGDGWHSRWPRPARLYSPPEEIQTVALLPDHPPKTFTWRGTRHRVRAADGPERVFGEWWRRPTERAAIRDYFRIEVDSGERYWVFRAGNGEDMGTGSQRWYVHGIFA